MPEHTPTKIRYQQRPIVASVSVFLLHHFSRNRFLFLSRSYSLREVSGNALRAGRNDDTITADNIAPDNCKPNSPERIKKNGGRILCNSVYFPAARLNTILKRL